MLQQARAIKAKLDISKGEADESSEEESEDGASDEDRGAWGSRKAAYYNADLVDMEGSEDEEDLHDEELEATRLQKETVAAMDAGDFGEMSEDESASEDGDNDHQDNIEQLQDRVGDDEAEDLRAAAVRQDALELKALVGDLRASLTEIRGRVGPLIREIKAGDIATSEGISYLEAKHILLLHYVASLMFYLSLKAEGRPVKDHPVVSRLVEIRSYLEKIRPIDKRLKYQIDKLLAATEAGEGISTENADTDLSHKPRPGALIMQDEDDHTGQRNNLISRKQNGTASAGDDHDGTMYYRAPKLNPVSMELDETDDSGVAKLSAKERRRQIQASRRASRSDFVQEFAAELEGAPQERRWVFLLEWTQQRPFVTAREDLPGSTWRKNS